jgi:F-type H+-transporting ATPase subunit b
LKRLLCLSGSLVLGAALAVAFEAPLLGSSAPLQTQPEAQQDSHQNQESQPAQESHAAQDSHTAPDSHTAEEKEESGQSNESLYKVINFAILVGALTFLLRKPLSGFFAQRTSEIQASIEEGRKALKDSEVRLKQVEEKMNGLEAAIAALRAEAEQEEEAELNRLREAAKAEAERIVVTAQDEIEGAGRVARLELKRYAAEQAIRLAEEHLRQHLDKKQRTSLVKRFLTKLDGSPEAKA